MKERFYGPEKAELPAAEEKYKKIKTPGDLYDILSKIWSADTCAPRMRRSWTEENMTLGQCSVTAFLAQDVFGGKVYGIPLPEGGVHCFNDVNGCVFDLTSAQFRGEKLNYENSVEQKRELHFAKEEKRLRYEKLRTELEKALTYL